MAALIRYIGTSHFRELFAHDLEKLGAAGHQAMIFARDEVVEVAHEVKEALVNFLGTEFEEVEEKVKSDYPAFYNSLGAEPAADDSIE